MAKCITQINLNRKKTESIKLHRLDSKQSFIQLYVKAILSLLTKRKKEKQIEFSALMSSGSSICTIKNIKTNHLYRYNQLCGIVPSTKISATYLQLLAFKDQLTILTDTRFPFPTVGLVHTANSVEQFISVSETQSLRYSSQVDHFDIGEKGITICLITHIKIAQRLVCRCKSDFLYRCNTSNQALTSQYQPILWPKSNEDLTIKHLPLTADSKVGRQFAVISGDFNPIHISSLLAKLFGFRKKIAHGMWLKSRVLASITAQLNLSDCFPVSVECQFKKPLYLPSMAKISYFQVDNTIHFQLSSNNEAVVYLIGYFQIGQIK